MPTADSPPTGNIYTLTTSNTCDNHDEQQLPHVATPFSASQFDASDMIDLIFNAPRKTDSESQCTPDLFDHIVNTQQKTSIASQRAPMFRSHTLVPERAASRLSTKSRKSGTLSGRITRAAGCFGGDQTADYTIRPMVAMEYGDIASDYPQRSRR